MVDYDKKIKELENEINALNKRKKSEIRADNKAKFDFIINQLEAINNKNCCLYVGRDIFESIKSPFDRFMFFFSYISQPITYKGYKVYENTCIDNKEIQIAFNSRNVIVYHGAKNDK